MTHFSTISGKASGGNIRSLLPNYTPGYRMFSFIYTGRPLQPRRYVDKGQVFLESIFGYLPHSCDGIQREIEMNLPITFIYLVKINLENFNPDSKQVLAIIQNVIYQVFLFHSNCGRLIFIPNVTINPENGEDKRSYPYFPTGLYSTDALPETT